MQGNRNSRQTVILVRRLFAAVLLDALQKAASNAAARNNRGEKTSTAPNGGEREKSPVAGLTNHSPFCG
jgi:hypothetical protein